MRVPSRFRISWADDATLKIESDAGQQTRLLRFEAPKVPPAPSRQGLSIARWQGRASLTVETSRLIPGYLQTNGVPYSANATMEEHFDVVKEPNGEAVADHRHHRHRPDVSLPHLRPQHALQEGSRRVEVGPAAVHREVVKM